MCYTGMNLENIMPCERSKSQRTTHIVSFHLHEVSRLGKSTEQKVAYGRLRLELGAVAVGVVAKGCGVSFWDNENVLKLTVVIHYDMIHYDTLKLYDTLKATELYTFDI